MTGDALRAAIAEIYRDVGAPRWAAPNLDGLADVLRDLSWRPEGVVTFRLPDLDDLDRRERERLLDVVDAALAESRGSARPLRAERRPEGR